jgi:coenzyme F420-dependent glucose-6-phosphate dehydrogenase
MMASPQAAACSRNPINGSDAASVPESRNTGVANAFINAPDPDRNRALCAMTSFSYHCSHEQFSPRELLELVQAAEAAGFDAAFSSDHLQPWSSAQGHSGFMWAWLGAALQATRRITFGAITVPGGWRYHPVVLAQAVATLAEMNPRRIPWIALGSGEAINERVVGAGWPDKEERNARLLEAAHIMRALLAGETVTHRGRLIAIDAKLWSLPQRVPKLIGAAISEATAAWVGGWADGLLTVGTDVATLRGIVDAFRRGGGDGKPIYLKADLSWAATEEEALRQAHEQWRFAVLGGDAYAELPTPADFETVARLVRPEDMRLAVHVSTDLERHVRRLQECIALGFEAIDLHNVGRNQGEFIKVFGSRVLPRLRR